MPYKILGDTERKTENFGFRLKPSQLKEMRDTYMKHGGDIGVKSFPEFCLAMFEEGVNAVKARNAS